MTTVGSPGPQVAHPVQMPPVHIPPPNRGTAPGYAAKTSLWLGGVQITVGSLSIILQVVAIIITASLAEIGTGIWCGIFYIMAGAFGVSAGQTKSKCMIVTHLVMSILAACFTVIHLTFSSIGAGSDNRSYFFTHYGMRPAQFAINLCLVLLALLEGVVAIIASAISCHGLCCASPPPSHGTVLGVAGTVQQVTYIQTPNGPQQVVVVTGGQQGMITQPGFQTTYPQQQQQPGAQQQFPQQPGMPLAPAQAQIYQPAYTAPYDPPTYQDSTQQQAPAPPYPSGQPAFNPDYK